MTAPAPMERSTKRANRERIMRTVAWSLPPLVCASLDDILARRASGAELRAEDQRRENPADKERERRRSQLGTAGVYRHVLVADRDQAGGRISERRAGEPAREALCPGACSSLQANGIAAEAQPCPHHFCGLGASPSTAEAASSRSGRQRSATTLICARIFAFFSGGRSDFGSAS
jgi:hypothetical protein